jgi:hypothetical protein
MMQIGIALNNYMMGHEVLPPGTQNASGPIKSVDGDGFHMSWMTQILPYLEQQNVYDHINFGVSAYDEANAPVRAQRIPTFLCPSDPRGSMDPKISLSNYCGVQNDYEVPIDVNQNGVLFLNSAIGYEQVRDGSSNTIYVTESRLGGLSELGWISGTRATLRNTGISKDAPIPVRAFGVGSNEIDASYFSFYGGNRWINDYNLEANWAHQHPEFVGGGGSYHTGGWHNLLGDGSVRFISVNIDFTTLRQLMNRADGEMMKDF